MIICENCVEEMKPYKKKLGHLKVWLRCPKCGAIDRQTNYDFRELGKIERLKDRLTEDNRCGGKHEYKEQRNDKRTTADKKRLDEIIFKGRCNDRC